MSVCACFGAFFGLLLRRVRVCVCVPLCAVSHCCHASLTHTHTHALTHTWCRRMLSFASLYAVVAVCSNHCLPPLLARVAAVTATLYTGPGGAAAALAFVGNIAQGMCATLSSLSLSTINTLPLSPVVSLVSFGVVL